MIDTAPRRCKFLGLPSDLISRLCDIRFLPAHEAGPLWEMEYTEAAAHA
jgi:hypothetical protein